jgi:hypothetical protein
MSVPNTFESLRREFSDLGLHPGMTVMVHSSLGKVGWTVGGPVTFIRAVLDVLGKAGTLVMPAESPGVSDPSTWNDDRVKAEWHDTIRAHLPVFDPLTTPTTMGAIPEAFRTFPGTLRSNHPVVSITRWIFAKARELHLKNFTPLTPIRCCWGLGSIDAHRCTMRNRWFRPGERPLAASRSYETANASGLRGLTWPLTTAFISLPSAKNLLQKVVFAPDA